MEEVLEREDLLSGPMPAFSSGSDQTVSSSFASASSRASACLNKWGHKFPKENLCCGKKKKPMIVEEKV